MARRVTNLPGFLGDFGKFPVQTGVTVPAKYREHVEAVITQAELDITFQTAMKLAILSFFPVPGYEKETDRLIAELMPTRTAKTNEEGATVVNYNFSNNPGQGLPTRDESKFPKKNAGQGLIFGKSSPEKTVVSTIEFVIPPDRETEEFFGGDPVLNQHKGYLTVKMTQARIILVIYTKAGTPIVEHEWLRRDFYQTTEFYESQAKGLVAAKRDNLKQFDPVVVSNAIIDAFESQFSPFPREDEEDNRTNPFRDE